MPSRSRPDQLTSNLGWSLGGFLSVTMARFLANDKSSNIHIKGMILIDSPFHVPWKESASEVSKAVLPKLPALVQKSFDNCKDLLSEWRLPDWSQQGLSEYAPGQTFLVPPHRILYQPLHGGVAVMPTVPFQPAEKNDDRVIVEDVSAFPPIAVLLRCTHPVPSADSGKPARVDLFRDKLVLGWDEHYPEFIKAVIDVDAHHYNLFEYTRSDFSKVGQLRRHWQLFSDKA